MAQVVDVAPTVRAAGPADLDAVLTLVAALGRPPAEPRDARQREVAAAILADPDSPVLLAELAERPVGVASLRLLRRLNWATCEARLLDLYVVPELRGSGVGRRLVEAGVRVAREHGCHLLRLECGHGRTASHAFYERLGLEDRGRDYQLTLRRRP